MEDRLIIKVSNPRQPKKGTDTIRIESSAMYELDCLQRSTGLSLKHLATKLILFAADRVKIEEDY